MPENLDPQAWSTLMGEIVDLGKEEIAAKKMPKNMPWMDDDKDDPKDKKKPAKKS